MDKDYLIKKWLNNDLSPQEKEIFNAMEDNAFFNELIEEGKRFKGQNPNKVPNFEALNDTIEKRSKPKVKWLHLLSKIAAIFIIGFTVFYFRTNNNLKEFTTVVAQKQTITLPDASEVILNETSTLKYNESKWKQKKSLHLEGEAFFDVTKGKQFDVETAQGVVSVLGTQFNVQVRDSIFNVVCYEGLVQVVYKEKIIQLPAGNAFKVEKGKSKEYQVSLIQPIWLQNMSVFEKAKISEVLQSLEKEYAVKIDFSEVDSTILFTGAFEHNDLKNSLEAITKTLNLTYEIKKDNLVIIKHGEN